MRGPTGSGRLVCGEQRAQIRTAPGDLGVSGRCGPPHDRTYGFECSTTIQGRPRLGTTDGESDSGRARMAPEAASLPCQIRSASGFPPAPPASPTWATSAPRSSTGCSHAGSGGSFVIRIEDTDQSRKVEGAVEAILETLRWLGVDWDEGPDVGGDYGPYVQSERLDLYRHAADGLLTAGRAYECYCGPDRLVALRREQGKLKERVGYDSRCRDSEARENGVG